MGPNNHRVASFVNFHISKQNDKGSKISFMATYKKTNKRYLNAIHFINKIKTERKLSSSMQSVRMIDAKVYLVIYQIVGLGRQQ